MPTIRVTLFAGRTVEQKRAFAESITRAAVADLGSTPDSVDVIFEDVEKHDWATAGKLWSDAKPG
ncbi:MAG: 4-oxalocrotonate tautomerase [Burkholderiales bacterium]|jgi:4-oxalocrotonate tautomerase|nr:4-oxalocrotonate tautomerase [Burkholderiales bacterium]